METGLIENSCCKTGVGYIVAETWQFWGVKRCYSDSSSFISNALVSSPTRAGLSPALFILLRADSMQVEIPDNFYKTYVWVCKRNEILVRDNYECQRCKSLGLYSKAECVHHVKHLEDHPKLALENDNLQSLCLACHNIVHPERLRTPEITKIMKEIPERW